jgi:signal peptidase I
MGMNWIGGSRRVVGLVWVGLLLALLGLVGVATLAPRLGMTTYIIRGGSMAPAIPLGALVADVPADAAGLAVGDVITVKTPADVVYTHRIVGIDATGPERRFELQGDANPSADPAPVSESAVIGKVSLFAPFVGYILALLSLPTGVISVMSMLGSLLLAYWLLEDLELADREAAGLGEASGILTANFAGLVGVGSQES